MIVDVENKQEALSIVPPTYRPEAKIVALNRFWLGETDQIRMHHGP